MSKQSFFPMKIAVFLFLSMIAVFASCSKEKRNEKRLAGIWEAKEVKYIFYENNQQVRDSVVSNSGALYLYDDNELDNQYRYSLAIVPTGFSTVTWNGNAGDPNTLMGTNIRKLTRKKLELSENWTDLDLNVYKTVIYYFERQ
jgi:hypothetical protein